VKEKGDQTPNFRRKMAKAAQILSNLTFKKVNADACLTGVSPVMPNNKT
jgi:hypothetical protein